MSLETLGARADASLQTIPDIDLGFDKPRAQTRVVVAMSGGVDSSVVAALVRAAGYETIGITLQLYDHGAAVHRALRPYAAAVPVNDALDVRQPDAGAFKFLVAVQALKHAEEFVCITRVETGAVVANEDHGVSIGAGGAANFYFGVLAFAGEFHCIGH